jgi:hypothetical protein
MHARMLLFVEIHLVLPVSNLGSLEGLHRVRTCSAALKIMMLHVADPTLSMVKHVMAPVITGVVGTS